MRGTIIQSDHRLLPSAWAKVLSHAWLIGLLFGTGITALFRGYFLRICPVVLPVFASPHLKIPLTLLPFLLSVFAVRFSGTGWLVLICGLKSACFVGCCLVLCMFYGQAGWLVRWFCMFCDICSLPLLFVYWLRKLSNDRRNRWYEDGIFLVSLIAFIIVDYRFVSPLAAKFGII